MMPRLAGVSGSLFPNCYLHERLQDDARHAGMREPSRQQQAALAAWWRRLEAGCGPVSPIRALVETGAEPLAGILGFRRRRVELHPHTAHVLLETPRHSFVSLLVLPWARSIPRRSRHVVQLAAEHATQWTIVLAPPFLSIADARSHAARRSLDFNLAAAVAGPSIGVLWAVASAQAFERAHRSADAPLECFLKSAADFQDRVRSDLQVGVVGALHALVRALATHATAGRRVESRFDEALTIVYRILFLLFAEARHVVPANHPIYRRAYALGTLCHEALETSDDRGLWEGIGAVSRLLRRGCRTNDLIVSPFNGHLFARTSAPFLETPRGGRASSRVGDSRDAAMRRTLVGLGSRSTAAGRVPINFADLGVDELGAVYERVLDVDPASFQRPATGAERRLAAAPREHSDRRKQTGTFYTPQPLVDFVVRRTLGPLVTGVTPEQILNLRIVDPAMGSGAFLVGACRYLADAYENALVAEGRAEAADFDDEERSHVRRRIAEQCLAGVDRSSVAVQLTRLSLWLSTLARGKPLGFLDHQLRVGDSLVGVFPADLQRSPEKSKGDLGSLPLFEDAGLAAAIRRVSLPLVELRTRHDDTVDDVRDKERLWSEIQRGDSPLERWRLASSLWCARWFWPEDGGPVPSASEIRAGVAAILRDDSTLRPQQRARLIDTARRVQRERLVFHWPLEFADVFYGQTGEPKPSPGFDAVIGNPPWEMLRDDGRDAAVGRTEATGGARGDRRRFVRFVRDAGLYPACSSGHVNLYQPFLERAFSIVRPGGRIGLVLPWGFASDDGAADLRAKALSTGGLNTIVGLDNGRAMFPIHRGTRFLVSVFTAGQRADDIRLRCGVKTSAELAELSAGNDNTSPRDLYPMRVTPTDLRSAGGPLLRLPDVRSVDDMAFLVAIRERFPALGGTDGWSARFGRDLNTTEDRSSFGTTGLPVVEGKHLQPFFVRLEEVRSRIAPTTAERLLTDRRFNRPRLAYRDVSGVGNRQILIAAILPAGTVTTHTVFCLRGLVPLERLHFLCAIFNSYIMNAFVRLLMGGHVTTSLVEELPVPPWKTSLRRIARLGARLARQPSSGPLNARLQAQIALLYGLSYEDLTRVLDTFPLVALSERDRVRSAFRRYTARRR